MNGFDEAARSAEMVRERKTTDTKLQHQHSKEHKNEDENMLKNNKGKNGDIAHNTNKKNDVLREKVFVSRESLLTDLFRISHIKTFRHIFTSLLIIISFQCLIADYTSQGRLTLDLDLLKWSFGDLGKVTKTWIPMQGCSLLLVYYFFKAWAHSRTSSPPKLQLFVDALFLLIYFAYLFFLLFLPLLVVSQVSLVCRIIILCEQVRILMKSHAFVRSNCPRVLNYGHHRRSHHHHNKSDAKSNDEKDNEDSEKKSKTICPSFSKYVYFMFAPTLVYKDDYPRTSGVRWRVVIIHFTEIIGVVIYTYFLFDRFLTPVFRNVKVRELDFTAYLNLISICILPGAMIQFLVFFAFLHSWSNMWAEMLCFADRQFYLDWWNSTSINAYYRTWNTLVQDWLYTYIYQDLYKILGKKYKWLGQFGVIFISSVFHEHILAFAFGFFYPIMFVQFSGFGFLLMFIPFGNHAAYNIFIWLALFTGLGIQLCLFSVEWYARETNQCPRTIDSAIFDFLIPRSIFCFIK